MKKTKKKILVVALIVSLVAILSLGSLAWFTANDTVTNTIKLADDFAVDVYETDGEGNLITEGEETVGVTYTNIMPGQEIHKDPTVRNTGTHPEWVRVHVTLSHYDIWSAAVKPDKETGKVDLSAIFTGFDPNAWKRYEEPTIDENANTVTYTFYLDTIKLEPNQAAALFTGVTIPGELTSEQAKTMNGSFTIAVEAEAIQSEYLPEEVTTAHEAFALLETEAEEETD